MELADTALLTSFGLKRETAVRDRTPVTVRTAVPSRMYSMQS